MRAVVLALVAVSAFGSTARADDSLISGAEQLTIEDLLKVAVSAAPELEAAAFDVAVARARQTVTGGAEDWLTSLSAQSTITKRPASSDRSSTTSATVQKRLPTNAIVQVSGNLSKTLHEEPRATNRFTSIDLSVAVTQPVLSKFGATSEKVLIRQAEHQFSAATIRRTATARAFVAEVVEAYWQLALSWRRLEVHQRSLEAAEKQFAAIQRGLQSGALARSEGVPFEQSIASRKIDIANTERDIINQSLTLRTLIGLELPPSSPAIRTADLPAVSDVAIDTTALVTKALAVSDELRAATEEILAAEVLVASSRSQLLPTLDLTLKGDVTGVHKTLADAVGELRFNPGYAVTLGAKFELPIGRGEARGTHATNRATLLRARFDLFAARKSISSQVIGLANDAKALKRTVELSAEVVRLAQQNVDAEQRKLEFGKSTSNEVVRRQTDLDNARLQLESVNAEATIVQVKLDAATGGILDRYGIHMIDIDRFSTQ